MTGHRYLLTLDLYQTWSLYFELNIFLSVYCDDGSRPYYAIHLIGGSNMRISEQKNR